jgi:MYXO-CTERM domain-containing protein
MKLKLNMVVAALALASAGAANAALTLAAAPGNSSMVFVAYNTAASTPVSLTIDLGFLMADFLASGSLGVPASAVFAPGSRSAPGTTIQWNFVNNTRTVNGVASAGNFQWSGTFSSFLSSGPSYQWGVLGADNLSGAASAINPVLNRNLLSTGTPTLAQITGYTASGNVSTGANNTNNFLTAANGTGTHTAGVTGASTAIAGDGFLGQTMVGNFGGGTPWSYLSAVGATSNLNWVNQATNPLVYQVGLPYGVDALSATPATFTFNGSTLTYVVPVPEADGIAMALAGLGMLGFIARRRRGA